MRILTKLVATAAIGAAIVMSGSAPSYAVTANVTGGLSYFADCLAKLGTDETCGGPREIDRGTSSIASSGHSASDPYCGPCYHVVWCGDEWHCKKAGYTSRRPH